MGSCTCEQRMSENRARGNSMPFLLVLMVWIRVTNNSFNKKMPCEVFIKTDWKTPKTYPLNILLAIQT